MAHSIVSALSIDVVSDVICPWCFLGKRRLDKALALVPEIAVEVTYRPFFLDPSIPAEGLSRQAYLTQKFGVGRLDALHDPLIAAGRADGVPYDFDLITRTPNSLDAHRLIRWALAAGKQHAVVEALFLAYWSAGRDVGDHAVLADIGSSSGMDGAAVARNLATDVDREDVLSEIHQAQIIGISGVPTFIMGQRYGVVGAQSAAVLADAMRKAAAD